MNEGGEAKQSNAPCEVAQEGTDDVRVGDVLTMAVDGTYEVGRAIDVLSVYGRLVCDIIGLQETRRSRYSDFILAGYLVYCSGECGGEGGGKKGQGGIGLAVESTITCATRPLEFIRHRVLKATLNYVGKPRLLRLPWRMPQLKHRMLGINIHYGLPWTELCRRYLNTNSCSC